MSIPIKISTADGSDTLFVESLNEQYHSLNGAITESNHVYIDAGFNYLPHGSAVNLLEIGFGTGLNCLLTALKSADNQIYTHYFGIEKYPLLPEITGSLNYAERCGGNAAEIFQKISSSPWGESIQITPWFQLMKYKMDMVTDLFPIMNPVNLVYFDAFGPDKQPDLWSREVFEKVSSHMAKNGILVTYSAKGQVRRNLASVGFTMERLPGPPGKREMLRGLKY